MTKEEDQSEIALGLFAQQTQHENGVLTTLTRIDYECLLELVEPVAKFGLLAATDSLGLST